jgi:hypothetical protein
LRQDGYEIWQQLRGRRKSSTYPQVDLDEDLQSERNIGDTPLPPKK